MFATSSGDISVALNNERPRVRLRAMLLAAGICALLTIPVAWNARHWISADGLSYLEVASHAAQSGPWPIFSNGYWSPGYPAILAIAIRLLRPSPASELIAVHSVDWLICVFTYLTFTWFLFNLLSWIQLKYDAAFAAGARLYVFLAFAYSLLFVSNLDVTLWLVGPHILLEAMVYLVAGCCLRLSLPGSRLLYHAALGVLLALAYVAKAALFPISVILIAILFVAPVSPEAGRKGTAITAMAFLLAAAPVVATLSYSKGRLTFGDAGRLTYAAFVNDFPYFEHGLLPASFPTLRHPPQTVSTNPPILKFDGPYQATVPLWYDPSYWYEGIPAHFDPRQQIRKLLGSLGVHKHPNSDSVLNLAERYASLLAGFAALALLGLPVRRALKAVRADLWLFLWPALAFFTFASVLVNFRYINSFIVLGSTTSFLVALALTRAENRSGIALTVAAGLLFTSVPAYGRQVMFSNERAAIDYVAAAGKLRAMGIRPGDALASTEFPYASGYLLRLAGAHVNQLIVVNPKSLAKLPADDVKRVLGTLRANGAKALLSYFAPAFNNDSGWSRLADDIYIRLL